MTDTATSQGARRAAAAALVALVALPLLAGLFAGLPGGFFRFPPVLIRTTPVPGFHPWYLAALALPGALTVWMLLLPHRCGFARPAPAAGATPAPRRCPAWLWAGLALNLAAWAASWLRPEWLGILRHHTFTPLWLGYVLVVDGLVFRRTGRSRLADSPRAFLKLFALSAAIWWYFEFVNRFVRNWWYEGVATFGWLEYTIFATLCFSTVLPAILGTADLLLSFSRFARRYAEGPRFRPWPRGTVRLAGLAGGAGLILLVLFPVQLFPLTWLAPLAVAAAALALAGCPTPFHDLARGDFSRLFALGLAALVCGFFWELWNFHALPKWHYAVPYVQVLRVFEMPLPGYLGYLPFGPICWCMAALLNVACGRRAEP